MSSFLYGFDDCEWSYYVRGHDEEEILQIDELDALQWEKLWMREIPASQVEDYGISDPDCDELALRDPETGRFASRMVWIECSEKESGAEPWMGVKYAPV